MAKKLDLVFKISFSIFKISKSCKVRQRESTRAMMEGDLGGQYIYTQGPVFLLLLASGINIQITHSRICSYPLP